MSNTDETQSIAQRYFKAWTSRDSAVVESLLDENLTFSFVSSGVFKIEGRERFLSGEAWPEGVKVNLLSEAYQGNTAFQMYEAVHGSATLRVVEKFVVRSGRIADIVFVTDQQAYEKFKIGHS
ncbi:MAG: nuclear transport factor 2 family protein [Ardenticatenaceae bacterium]|nr:nuclear transport factor 2 family protein [Ardenticatenaceae bacterium]